MKSDKLNLRIIPFVTGCNNMGIRRGMSSLSTLAPFDHVPLWVFTGFQQYLEIIKIFSNVLGKYLGIMLFHRDKIVPKCC